MHLLVARNGLSIRQCTPLRRHLGGSPADSESDLLTRAWIPFGQQHLSLGSVELDPRDLLFCKWDGSHEDGNIGCLTSLQTVVGTSWGDLSETNRVFQDLTPQTADRGNELSTTFEGSCRKAELRRTLWRTRRRRSG